MAKQPTNLLIEMDEDQRRALGQKVVRMTEEDLRSRSGWSDRQVEHMALWACDAPKRTGPWEGSANVCVPMVTSAINNWAGITGASMFENPAKEWVTTIPNNAIDIKRAERVEKYLNWQLMFEQEGRYESSYDRLLPHLAITGMAYKKIIPDYENEAWKSEFVPSLDVIVPDDTTDLAIARRITHREEQHIDRMNELAEDGFYLEDQIERLNTPASDNQEQEPNRMRQEGKTRLGLDASENEQKPHYVYEQHFRGKVDGLEGKRWIVWVDAATSTPLRLVKHPESIRNFFVDFHFIPSPDGGYHSYGFGHFLRELNEIINTLFNQYLDAGTISNLPMAFYGRSAGLRGRKIKFKPGGAEEISDVSQLLLTKFPGVDQNLPLLIEFVLRFAQDITANTDEVQGRAQKGVREPTVRGQSGRFGQAMTRFKVFAKRVYRSQNDELRIVHEFNRLIVSEEKQFFVLGSNEGRAFESIEKDDFKVNVHIMTTADPDFASQQQRRSDATTIMQVALQHPQLAQNANALAKITDDWLVTMGRGDLTRYTQDATDPPMSPYDENILFANGETEEPKTGEDHDRHMRVHLLFAQTAMFLEMDNEYKRALQEHVQGHEIQKSLEQQARAQQEAQGANGQGSNAGVGGNAGGQGFSQILGDVS